MKDINFNHKMSSKLKKMLSNLFFSHLILTRQSFEKYSSFGQKYFSFSNKRFNCEWPGQAWARRRLETTKLGGAREKLVCSQY